MEFQNTQEFARKLDGKDEVAPYRARFSFPRRNGEPVIYLTGNSLGLQPFGVREAVLEELDDWARLGVEGHHQAHHPWYSYHESFADPIAQVVGALPREVVVMNQLTVNLQLLLMSFYRPEGSRRKILFEARPFPSDHYAFESQARLHGLSPEDVLVEMQPRAGEYILRTEDIIEKINTLGSELALVCFGGVNYFTGQYFDLDQITKASHRNGAISGFDLAHAAGNVPLSLHDWNVDFACWCSYKYLNSGPGGVGGAFVHEKHLDNKNLIRLAGWWGHNKETRFNMEPGFDPIPSAEAWQLSNAPVLSMSVHRIALESFVQVGMKKLREKSVLLTGYLEFILKEIATATAQPMEIITPPDPASRGCQISIILASQDGELVKKLSEDGVMVDFRKPNVFRMAPVPLYNSFEDVFLFGKILKKHLTS